MPPETEPTPETGQPAPQPNLDPAPKPPVEPDPPAEQPDDLAGLKSALRSERELRKAADARVKELSPYEKAVKEAEEANKSETTKLNEALNGEREARTKAERDLLRYTVAADKGVPANLVKFLSGTTKEEVEQSATELLAELGTTKPSMPGRPTERLTNGKPSNTNKLDTVSPEELIRMGRGIDAR